MTSKQGSLSRWVLLRFFVVVFAVSTQACSSEGTPAHLANSASANIIKKIDGQTMGTYWTLQWRDSAVEGDMAQAQLSEKVQTTESLVERSVQSELERINSLMSTWDPASELSQFNGSAHSAPVVLHADTLKVIDTAIPISQLTTGRYDITLAPVIDLWGFNRDTPANSPDQVAIDAALALSGTQLLVRSGDTLRKREPEVSVDVSSLAKGYAVDKLGELVESLDIKHYLVDIGGELRARGDRGGSRVWRVGIESPEAQVEQVIALHNTHIASSGSYRNYRVEDGRRVSHIIDGKTGRPIDHDLVSVNVLHESTMLADAWATALLVVGAEDAWQLIEQRGLTAQLTVLRDGRFQRIATEDFQDLLLNMD